MYYEQYKDIIVNNILFADIEDLGSRFDLAMSLLMENAANREKKVLENPARIELEGHVYPNDVFITADIYDFEGESFQFVVEDISNKRQTYTPGRITQ